MNIIVAMALKYDLHSHSTASDGTLTPSELVERARGAGVDVLALTDHDSTEGVREAESAARSAGIKLIPGIELSVTWNRQTVHVVGLNIDIENRKLQQGLEKLVEFRDWRAEEIGRRLEKAGIHGAFEGARKLSNGRLLSRTHFARFLVEKGEAKSVRHVFKHFLVSGKPGHVSGDWASLEEAVGWIRYAGGQAVVAHPARYSMTRSKLRRLLREFIECGGAGIEVVSGSQSRDEAFTMAKHASDYQLLASSGSDFHGPENPWVELGALPELPHGCRPIWGEWHVV